MAPAPWLRGSGAIEHVDASDLSSLERLVEDLRPDVVVNCLGIIKQRAASHEALPSLTINSLLPHRLSSLVARWDGRFVHFSTDCVFSGRRGNYEERDSADAADIYGRTKFLSERSRTPTRSLSGRRSSAASFGTMAHCSTGFCHSVVGVSRISSPLVVRCHHADLAEMSARVVDAWPTLTGVYQLSSGRISKYNLLSLSAKDSAST